MVKDDNSLLGQEEGSSMGCVVDGDSVIGE